MQKEKKKYIDLILIKEISTSTRTHERICQQKNDYDQKKKYGCKESHDVVSNVAQSRRSPLCNCVVCGRILKMVSQNPSGFWTSTVHFQYCSTRCRPRVSVACFLQDTDYHLFVCLYICLYICIIYIVC